MAKDPAILLYTQDFLVGTMTMDFEQKGKYIHLLCLQHQKGKLTEKDLQTVLTDTDVDVAEKFNLHSDGFYYNERMLEETVKRKAYSESRRKNRAKKTYNTDVNNICKSYDNDMNNISKTYVKHMENENENENEIVNDNINVNENVNKNTIPSYAICYNLYAQLMDDMTNDKVYEDIVADCNDIGWNNFYTKMDLSEKQIQELKDKVKIRLGVY